MSVLEIEDARLNVELRKSLAAALCRSISPSNSLGVNQDLVGWPVRHHALRMQLIENYPMPTLYEIKKNRLPLPPGPLSERYAERKLTISAKPDVYSSEAHALQRARVLVQEGYGISIVLSDGREWSHEEIFRRLHTTVS